MLRTRNRGFTLIELLIAITIMAAIFVSVARLVAACLRVDDADDGTPAVYEEGLLAMEKMVAGVKACTYLYIPNNHNSTRDILAFSGGYNDDSDSYFGDALFERIDEDTPSDMSNDSFPGLALYDDDGDGAIDEAGGLAWTDAIKDDDEDGLFDEDPLDGIDNDGDGNIDEDLPADSNADAAPGAAQVDDDADGSIDESGGGDAINDDEDLLGDEDAADASVYYFDSGGNVLWEAYPRAGTSGVLCNNVTAFSVVYTGPDANTDAYITISLTLAAPGGESLTIVEDVYPRNIVQKCGKRVK
jgi:prepilin-type N-terminal cleavage/methylation domain-containing protein